jgi:hypothetical protein
MVGIGGNESFGSLFQPLHVEFGFVQLDVGNRDRNDKRLMTILGEAEGVATKTSKNVLPELTPKN